LPHTTLQPIVPVTLSLGGVVLSALRGSRVNRPLRIRVLSDLHNEFGPADLRPVDADVIVLSGDIDVGKRGLEWAVKTLGPGPIIYVAGNHEYHGRAIPKLTHELTELGRELGVYFLERDGVVIDDVRFLGCCLWTDFGLRGQPHIDSLVAEETMTDFRRTRVSPAFRRVRARDHKLWHSESVAWLRSEMASDPVPTVVVTHHAFSARSLAANERAPIDAAYASDLESLFLERRPHLWVHGHTHRCADYTLGETRIVSNPRGYRGEFVEGFDLTFVVEVDAD
jgi:predicted phosphodiesterase